MPTLDSLSVHFRNRLLYYHELTEQLRTWADAYPEVCALSSLGQTPEGRELWLLTIGREPERKRPSVWVDGNMHAVELSGTSVALGIAEDVLRLHTEPDADVAGLPPHLREALRDVRFFIMPRISPDGAEAVLTTGRYVRSVPRDARGDRNETHFVCSDVDGDGLSLVMRRQDPAGDFVESSELPGLMLPRRLEDEGPFYAIYPEGFVEGWDGHTVPAPGFLSDNEPDLNRNFPYDWRPEHEQMGAGRYPGSEPESRAVIEHAVAHPEIFAWLNLHTFGGVHIRPLGHSEDNKMEPSDLALYRQIEAWTDEFTGYPMVSGFEQFTYEPGKPLRGDLSEFAYEQRGCISWACEIWDLFEQVGLPKPKRFVDRYTHLDREELIKLAEWDRDENDGKCLPPWRPFTHPQLGEVEVGGLDPRFGLWNPPRGKLPEICAGISKAYLRVAAMLPRVEITVGEPESLGDGLHRVVCTIQNHGYLPSYGLASSKKHTWNEELLFEASGDGLEVLSPSFGRTHVGHLEGWGRGRFGGGAALYFLRSRGNAQSRRVVLTVRGRGRLKLRLRGPRIGDVSAEIELE
ncbi:MAG: peptidase M14 [Deltaproteobacteria bacterium]|nr:peptidase M14 [Deltaproteobacteria bacterium]